MCTKLDGCNHVPEEPLSTFAKKQKLLVITGVGSNEMQVAKEASKIKRSYQHKRK